MTSDLRKQAAELASKGRNGDEHLLHITDREYEALMRTGLLTINPHTGLPEASFLDSIGDFAGNLLGGATNFISKLGDAGPGNLAKLIEGSLNTVGPIADKYGYLAPAAAAAAFGAPLPIPGGGGEAAGAGDIATSDLGIGAPTAAPFGAGVPSEGLGLPGSVMPRPTYPSQQDYIDMVNQGGGTFTKGIAEGPGSPFSLPLSIANGAGGATPAAGPAGAPTATTPAAPAPAGGGAPGAAPGAPAPAGTQAASQGGSFMDDLMKQFKQNALGLGLIGGSALLSAGQKPVIPNQDQLNQLGTTAANEAKQLIDQYNSAKLSPGQQAGLDQLTNQTKNQIRQYFASIGQSDSTAMQQALSQVDAQALQMKQQMLDNMLQQGLNAIGIAQGPLNQVAQYSLAQDQQLRNAFNNFAGSVGNLFGRTSGTTTPSSTGTQQPTTSATASPTISSAQSPSVPNF